MPSVKLTGPAVTLAAIILAGCQYLPHEVEVPVQEQPLQTIAKPAELPFSDFPGDGETRWSTESGVQMSFSGGSSPVLAYRMPAQPTRFNLILTSLGTENTIFAPSVRLLDANHQVMAEFSLDDFEYLPARLIYPDRLQLKINDVGRFYGHHYLMVFSPPEQQAGTTAFRDPAVSYALATNREPPPVEDIQARHVTQGRLRFDLASLDPVAPASAATSPAHQAQPESVAEPVQEANSPQPVSEQLASEQPADQETPAIVEKLQVLDTIREHVAAGRIEEALDLSEKAQAQGIPEARAVFVEALRSRP